jgi:signal peptidase II
MAGSWSLKWRFLAAALIFVGCLGCDQVTKRLATSALRDGPPRTYLGGAVRMEYALNPGGFLSSGSGLPEGFRRGVFIATNCCLSLTLGLYLIVRRNMHPAQFVALLLVLAGGIGNLIDRVFNQGLVIDFLHVGLGPVRTGVFNVADVAITFGGIVAILLFQQQPKPQFPSQ